MECQRNISEPKGPTVSSMLSQKQPKWPWRHCLTHVSLCVSVCQLDFKPISFAISEPLPYMYPIGSNNYRINRSSLYAIYISEKLRVKENSFCPVNKDAFRDVTGQQDKDNGIQSKLNTFALQRPC